MSRGLMGLLWSRQMLLLLWLAGFGRQICFQRLECFFGCVLTIVSVSRFEVCPICCNGAEIILHALRDCSHLKHVWNQLGVMASNYDFWHVNWVEWLSLNVRTNDKPHVTSAPWKIVFSFALWSIWKSRNDIVFNRKGRSQRLAMDIVHQAMEYIHYVATPRLHGRRVLRRIQWE